MTIAAPARPARDVAARPTWLGDSTIVVYATRYALTVSGHVPEFVRQSIEANAGLLTVMARGALVRDITAWLNGPAGAAASPVDRAVWVAALAALGVDG